MAFVLPIAPVLLPLEAPSLLAANFHITLVEPDAAGGDHANLENA